MKARSFPCFALGQAVQIAARCFATASTTSLLSMKFFQPWRITFITVLYYYKYLKISAIPHLHVAIAFGNNVLHGNHGSGEGTVGFGYFGRKLISV